MVSVLWWTKALWCRGMSAVLQQESSELDRYSQAPMLRCYQPTIFLKSDKKFWFKCDVCPHKFESVLYTVTNKNNPSWCPYCTGRVCAVEGCTAMQCPLPMRSISTQQGPSADTGDSSMGLSTMSQ